MYGSNTRKQDLTSRFDEMMETTEEKEVRCNSLWNQYLSDGSEAARQAWYDAFTELQRWHR